MSDTLSAGHDREEAKRILESRCKDSRDGKHDWKEKGSWPSEWKECEHCETCVFL
jgi:hypothetical protein